MQGVPRPSPTNYPGVTSLFFFIRSRARRRVATTEESGLVKGPGKENHFYISAMLFFKGVTQLWFSTRAKHRECIGNVPRCIVRWRGLFTKARGREARCTNRAGQRERYRT